MASSHSSEALTKVFVGLRNKTTDVRLQSAMELRRYVARNGGAAGDDDNISRRLKELIHSQNSMDNLGGLIAIDHLIDVEGEVTIDSHHNLFRFYNYVKYLLPSPDPTLILTASKTLGRILAVGGPAFGENFMEHQVPAAVALINSTHGGGDKLSMARYAGTLILKELALNMPVQFHAYLSAVLDNVLAPLRDPRLVVREAAAELLAECLEIGAQRERTVAHAVAGAYLSKILADAQAGLKFTQPEILHGSLLTYRELLLHAGAFMKDSFIEMADAILAFQANRDPSVRRMVVAMIPTFASYDKFAFKEQILHKAMRHLLSQLDKPHERDYALIAIGHTAAAVGAEMKPFLETLMSHINGRLQETAAAASASAAHGPSPSPDPVLTALGLLAAAVGPMLTRLMHDLLHPLFAAGLSESLPVCLRQVALAIPQLLGVIQDRLLNLLSHTLSGTAYARLGAPPVVSGFTLVQLQGKGQANRKLLTLALDTLGSFDFSGHVLTEFAQSNALPYVEDDVPEVRRAAALACCRLFGGAARGVEVGPDVGSSGGVGYQTSRHAVDLVSIVLGKLLTVGIADRDPTIRNIVLGSLDEQFDRHLSQAENVRSLFIALNDEVFENRLTAARLIGRMARHNPAYVLPSLRKTMIQLLTDLEYSTVALNREESTRLLTTLVHNTQRLIRPYALPMFAVLLQKAQVVPPSASMLICLAALASVGGEDAGPYLPQLMPALVAGLSDPSPTRREAALSALGRVCSSTGNVIAPLVDYPGLLPLLGRILRAEGTRDSVRREVVKVIGVLGAMDPYRWKVRPHPASIQCSREKLTGIDDYFQTVVVAALLRVLKDPTSSGHHHTVIEAIMSIFKTQGLKCVGILPQVMPAFTAVTRSATLLRVQEFHLQQLAILVGIIKEHVRNYAAEVLGLVAELWDNTTVQTPIVALIEAMGRELAAELKPFLPTILPLFLKVFAFDGELSEKRMSTQMKIFDALQTFGMNIEEYLHLVIPIIVRSAESSNGSVALRCKAMGTIDKLSKVVNFSDYASRIVQSLMRTLELGVPELQITVLDTLCSLILQLDSDFLIFVPTVKKCLIGHPISHPGYDRFVMQLLNGERLTHATSPIIQNDQVAEVAPAETVKLTVNQLHLKRAWDTAEINAAQDWIDWIHRLGVELIKESPSHALRACMSLVETQSPLAKELFNVAFLSCWGELYEQYQDHLVHSIEIALTSPTTPSEVIGRLLDLCEFMEREHKPLPIEHSTLGECSTKVLAYAKALHYKELECFGTPSPTSLESLISINMRLQQHDAASGVLLTARGQYDVTTTQEWYERLGRWQEALMVYDEKAEAGPGSTEIQIGRMRCLHALGEWEQLASEVDERWSHANHEDRRSIAPMAAAAAWSLSEWDSMDKYIATMPTDSSDRFFYRAILLVHHNQFPKALTNISKARQLLYPELTSFGGPGYARSYNVMVRAQMLSELEEVITYKQYADQPERQQTMRTTWMKRLQGCQPDVDVWQRILQVRTMVISPEDDPVPFIKFANLCRKSDRMTLAEKTINSLLSPDRLQRLHEYHHTKAPPNVVYAQLKYMWSRGAREESLAELRQFAVRLAGDLKVESSDDAQLAGPPEHRFTQLSKLLARCYFKQGEWQAVLNVNWYRNDSGLNDVLHSYLLATSYDEGWYKAWHTWAMANFNVVTQIETQPEARTREISGELLASHVVQSIEGFFRSISLRNEDALQDTLRLLTLWFKYGSHDEISQVIASGFSMVKIDTWLPVIPQIIARIQTPHANIRRNLNHLLADVGKSHPHALIYPLTVGSKSPSESRKNAALSIMDRMREHSATIVEQARIVGRELIRVAILWHELWYDALEEVLGRYYTVRNPDGMLSLLEPLYELLDAGPQTIRETSFNQVFGAELRRAREACRQYQQSGETRELENAWAIYIAVFQRLGRHIQQVTVLDLKYVSPELLSLRNLDLAVPGTYQSGREVIYITSFALRLTVIGSKQHPRRMTLTGSDGRDYQYLLKGHEDLRQDERVMQFFGLVNTLLSIDTNSFKRQLHIQRYPLIPLAPNVGLIGVMQESDTLHELVKDYRRSVKVVFNIEYRLMLQMAPDYENLPLLHKIEVFEYAMENTSGQDLYKILWLKSTNSEHWLERRAAYTRSLGVNSMVGHILGLGDRHPSNLMLERKTGKVVHVDFGDCFEVAMHRDKFPEKVPFRLTRMLTHAMEVSGIEGSFRKTCEISMQVLRDNEESLMAVLEAFVYDPLINWRLVQADADQQSEASESVANLPAELAWVEAHAQGGTRPLLANENEIFNEAGGERGVQEVRNKQALVVYNRVQHKLTGRDFNRDIALSVEDQVDKLIRQAMSVENLCQAFSGWCAVW
ncbi:phosphatidylinositol 3-kinase [Mycena vulgaris]|nr:phosphatidylinositol 3-kinase [Mycena vulgaris]